MSSKFALILLLVLGTSVSVVGQVNCPASLPLTVVGNTEYCVGSAGATLSINETYAGYQWLPTSETSQSVLLTAGSYQAVVIHYTGCTDTVDIEVEQVSNPPQPTIDVSGPTQFCQGESVVLTVPTWYPYYFWNTGSVSDEITVIESGTYSVSVEDWIGCSSSSNSVQIIVDPLPTAAFSPNVNLFDVAFMNLSLHATDYQWNFGDGNTSTDFEPTYTYTAGGLTPMYLVAANNCGTDTAFLNLQSVGILNPNNPASLQLYPNPNAGSFYVEYASQSTATPIVTVFNAMGQTMENTTIQQQHNGLGIQTKNLVPGMYILQVQHENQTFLNRFMIE